MADNDFDERRDGIMIIENAAFNDLMKIAGWSGKYNDEVTITGQDPVLRTGFRIGETAAGIHAAHGVAISNLWELKTGRRQRVAIDVRAATATMSSIFTMKINGEQRLQQQRAQQRTFTPGFYKTRDGHRVFNVGDHC